MYSTNKNSIIELISNELSSSEDICVLYVDQEERELLGEDISKERAIEIMRGRLKSNNVFLLFDDWHLRIFETEHDCKTFLLKKANSHKDDYTPEKEYDDFYESIIRNIIPIEKSLYDFSILAYCMAYEVFQVK